MLITTQEYLSIKYGHYFQYFINLTSLTNIHTFHSTTHQTQTQETLNWTFFISRLLYIILSLYV